MVPEIPLKIGNCQNNMAASFKMAAIKETKYIDCCLLLTKCNFFIFDAINETKCYTDCN